MPRTRRLAPLDPANCGTRNQYLAHRRRKEPTCGPCRAANNRYTRDYKRSLFTNCPTCQTPYQDDVVKKNGTRYCPRCGGGKRRHARCGTPSGYRAHLHYGEEPCQRCREASRLRKAQERKLRTHCTKDHEYTPENTAYNAIGKRRCRTCAGMQVGPLKVSASMAAFLAEMYGDDNDDGSIAA